VSEEEFEAGKNAYKVSLPSGGFEGPLDLLLHLCQKHELQILDIPIAFITEKYLEYLAVMQLMDLDIAAEYLVMAATLAHIKSKMLLPAPPPGQEDELLEEEEDPRAALIRRLLEYQKYKKAAEDLQARGVAGRDVFPRGAAIEEAIETGLPPLAEIPLFRLVEAFQGVLSRTKVKLAHDVIADRISITDRIHQLADVLRVRRRLSFEDLFEGLVTRFDLVITFLALLEMTRLRMTRLFQTEPLSPLYVELAAEDTIAPPEMPLDAEASFAPPPAPEPEDPVTTNTEPPMEEAHDTVMPPPSFEDMEAAEPAPESEVDEEHDGHDTIAPPGGAEPETDAVPPEKNPDGSGKMET
jgi:segregation and condensation protein A